MSRPVVERITPQLAVGREIVRRNTGDERGTPALSIELEEVRTRPNIRAIESGENWRIPNDADAELCRFLADLSPLAKKEILSELVAFGTVRDLAFQLLLLGGGK